MRLARLLLILTLALLAGPSSTEAAPVPLRRAGIALRREARNLRRTLSSPPKLARIVATSAVGYGVGLVTLHGTDSTGAAAFASYVANVASDRLIDRLAPSTRPYGMPAPPSLGRHAVQALAGAGVAGLSAPFLISALQPLSRHLSALGDGAPGLIGVGTRALLSQTFVRGLGSGVAGLVASGAQLALRQLMKLRPRRAEPSTEP